MKKAKISIFKILLGGILLQLWFPACRDLPDPKVYIFLDEEMTSYFSFPEENSVFIYQDTITGQLDTMTLYEKTTLVQPHEFTIEQLETRMDYESSFLPDFYTLLSKTDSTTNFGLFYSHQNWAHPIIKQNDMITQTNSLSMVDRVVVHGVEYNQVIKSESSSKYATIWFAPGIGIIRKEIDENPRQVFDLVEYELE